MLSSFLLFIFISFSFSIPPFILKEREFRNLISDLKIRFDAYFLLKGLNRPDKEAIVFFDDDSKRIKLVLGNKEVVVNKEFLEKEKKKFVYLSRGAYFDGKYIYVYSSIKYGRPKYVVLFRVNPENMNVKYMLFNNPPQALTVKFFADGKGNVLIAWIDEDKPPYRIVWAYSNNFMETVQARGIISEKKGIFIFKPILFYGKPYIFYAYENKLLAKNLLNDKTITVLKGVKPINIEVIKKDNNFWIYFQDGNKSVNLYKLNKNFQVEKGFTLNNLKVRGEVYTLDKFIWSLYQCEIVKERPVCAITAKFAHLPGVKVNGITLPDKYNVFVNEGNTFYIIHDTKPFMITYTFPRLASDENGWIVTYFGRKFVNGNVFVSYNGLKGKRNIAIENPRKETGFPKVVNIAPNVYRILYPVREGEKTFLKTVDIVADKLVHYYKFPPKDVLMKKLKERINKFLECQVKDDLDCIYSLTDPVSREIFKSTKKVKIDVLSYRYDKIKIIENSPFAICEGEIKVLIPKGTFIGIDKDMERVIKTTDVWVYMNDEWYYVPPAPMVNYYLKW